MGYYNEPPSERSPTPAYDEDKVGKKRIRLVKRLPEEEEEDAAPSSWKEEEEDEEEGGGGRKGKRKSVGSKGGEAGGSGDPEMQELWDIIAGGGESEEEVSNLPEFKGPGKKKKKIEKSPAELAFTVEHLMAELEVTAEEDAELNRQSKPAINKFKKLPLLVDVLSKKKLQQEFLDHGVLTLLKNWLEPLPDGSLPNMYIRTAILQILADFPIDLEQHDRREQLKKSGLGRVIMFLSKSQEEATSNRKLAQQLVDKWSRTLFNKDTTSFEDVRRRRWSTCVPCRSRPAPTQKPMTTTKEASWLDSSIEDDLDEFSQLRPKSAAGRGADSRQLQRASRPEALPFKFTVRPQSKVDAEQIRAARCDPADHQQRRRMKVIKKLRQLKAAKKKPLQASRPSAQGRGMLSYL